jgi:hypothetical protein
MRGDSIRDLYAKTLALMGLGVLAGAGALVDYWPSGTRLPRVVAVFPQPAEFALPPIPVPEQVPVAAASVARVRRPAPIPARAAVDVPSLPVAVSTAGIAADPVELVAPLAGPAPAPALAPVSVLASAGEEIALSDPDLAVRTDAEPVEMVAAFSAPSAALGVDDHPAGVITGALKSAGSSIVRTGMKTGASFVDMLRVVNRAMRRALPAERPGFSFDDETN